MTQADDVLLITGCRIRNEFVTLEDGFKYWCGSPSGNGAMSAHNLRVIADYLDSLNADWAAQVGRELMQAASDNFQAMVKENEEPK